MSDVNYNAYTASPYTISVGGVDRKGTPLLSNGTASGAGLLLVAPSAVADGMVRTLNLSGFISTVCSGCRSSFFSAFEQRRF